MTYSIQEIPYKVISWFFSKETLQAIKEWQDILKVMKGNTYNQQNSTQQGSHSDLTEKSKALQTSKGSENSVPPNQLYNKC